MRLLNQAAKAYNGINKQMAASAEESMPVLMNGKSNDNNQAEKFGPTNWPPNNTPKMMEAIVKPSIQPLALTNCDAGNNSVKMPYLAGE